MTSSNTFLWTSVEKAVGIKIDATTKRRWGKQYPGKLIDLAAYIERYIDEHPAEHKKHDAIWTLMRLLRDGDWPLQQKPPDEWPDEDEPAARRASITLTPYGFTGDPILEQMPPLIQCLAEARLENTGICVDFALAGAIATVTAACGNRLRFKAWGDEHYVNLYILLVGSTGKSFKSSVLARVKDVLSNVDSDSLAADEGSVEALIKDLAEKPARLWIRDEFAGLLSAIKGQDYMKPIRELLLSLFDHRGVYRRRLTRGEWRCVNPALSFLASIQPGVMGEELFSGRNIDSGLVNRLLLVCGEGVEPYWPTIDYDPLRAEINGHLRRIMAQPPVVAIASHLTRPAAVWDGRERDEFGPYGDLVARRAAIVALKLATVFEAATNWPAGKRIDDHWLDVALRLLERWYKASVIVIEREHVKNPAERDRRDYFIEACHASHNKTGPQTLGKLQASAHISSRKSDEYQRDLTDRGWITVDDDMRVVCTRASLLCEVRQ